MPQPSPESPRRAWTARLWTAVRPRIAIALVALGAIAAVAWLAPRFLLGPRVEATLVVRRDFVQSVVASGHVEAPHRVNIGVQVTGVVRAVPVAEGQHVRAGQVLIELDSAEWSAALAQAEAAVSQARARLRQLREVQAPVAAQTVRQAEVNLENARAQLRRNILEKHTVATRIGRFGWGDAPPARLYQVIVVETRRWRVSPLPVARLLAGSASGPCRRSYVFLAVAGSSITKLWDTSRAVR